MLFLSDSCNNSFFSFFLIWMHIMSVLSNSTENPLKAMNLLNSTEKKVRVPVITNPDIMNYKLKLK